MKLFKRLVSDKKGFSLIEVVAATSIVAIAASMSVGVFVSSQRVNFDQSEVNKGQNTAISSMEANLASGGSTSNDTGRFTMEPTGVNGFASLSDGGRVQVNYDESSDGDINYKIFKHYSP